MSETEIATTPLYEPLATFVDAACEYLSQSKLVDYYTQERKHDLGSGPGHSFIHGETRPDFKRLVDAAERHLLTLPSFASLVRAVTGSPLTTKYFGQPDITEASTEAEWNGAVLDRLASPFLQEYLLRVGELWFDGKQFASLFDELDRDLRRPDPELRKTTPLFGVSVTTRVDLGDGWCLRPLEPGEVESWLNPEDSYVALWRDADHLLAALEFARPVPVGAAGEDDRGTPGKDPKATVWIYVLRLMTDRRIQAAFTFSTARVWSRAYTWRWQGQVLRGVWMFDEPAQLDEALAARAALIWRQACQGPNAKHVDLALRRWARAVMRPESEDQLIDYWVGLESIFGAGSTSEAKYRVCLRAAAFVGSSDDERVYIYKDLRDSYDWRSRVAHGGNKGSAKDFVKHHGELAIAVTNARSCLRRALLRLLEAEKLLDSLGIEAQLLRGQPSAFPAALQDDSQKE
jgi:hypothetical protein